MNVWGAAGWLAIVGIMASATPACAQARPAATDGGPGKIFCRTPTSCELDIGTPVSLRYKIDPAALPAADKDRLTRQCKVTGTPCVATVTGADTKAGVKAASIKFYN